MVYMMRQSTLQTIGLGTVLEIFKKGELPVNIADMVDRVFGKGQDRGCMVISGANGIVGAGKAMQLGSRLEQYGVLLVALDFPGIPDGIGKHYSGLVKSFGGERAAKIMENIVRITYDGKTIPQRLKELKPRFLLEAIPEILQLKKAHYGLFKSSFPEIEIRSVTSGFPSSKLGVGVAHPAFPHQINKIWEIVEPKVSDITKLFWSLGLIPISVSDDWSFVLDVLFCGITLAALKYHQCTNMPYWKIDKYVRRLVGPNPLRAHDMIGAKGADFLTWSCLHHLSEKYGALFNPTSDLDERKDTGQEWYPAGHFRPIVDWPLDTKGEEELKVWLLGSLFQMASLIVREKRSHLSGINAIGELCAQFRKGVLAMARAYGEQEVTRIVREYQNVHPGAAGCWYPEVFEKMSTPEWQQLYVNAEHDGEIGVITINRESYTSDVDAELCRAIDWLKNENIDRVIVSGDFHFSQQLVGADTSEFYPALNDDGRGLEISGKWSKTARRLNDEFKVSVGFVNGKRCLGGMLELMMHCHYLVAAHDSILGMPEVTLPVVPGMEGCHWPFRRMANSDWRKMIGMLLTGELVKANDAVGWLVDYAGTMEDSLKMALHLASGNQHGLKMRPLNDGSLKGFPGAPDSVPASGDPRLDAARRAIFDCVKDSVGASLSDAITVQAKHSAAFMGSDLCRKGKIGEEYKKIFGI